jgi:arginine repressor
LNKALLFLPLLSLLKGPDSATPFRQDDTQNEAYRVYSALIEQKIPDKTVALVFIEATTLPDPLDRIALFKQRPDSTLTTMNQSETLEHLRKKLSLVSQATIDDFLNNGKKTVRLKKALDGTIKYRLMSHQQYRQMRDESQNNLPELICFSRVGFNVERTQALVLMETHGGTDGESFFVLLEKDGSKWVIKQRWNGQ